MGFTRQAAVCLALVAVLDFGGHGTGTAAEPSPPVTLAKIPRASLSQTVGITAITVDYTRPALAGRALAAIARPGTLWAPGDGFLPRISFSRDVDFMGRPVAAGTYLLLAVPAATRWTIILNRDLYLTDLARYRPDLDVARAPADVAAALKRERLSFAFAELSDEAATLELGWGDVSVRMSIGVHTTAQIQTAIRELDGAWRWYAQAAVYMRDKRKDPRRALALIEQALALQENDENLRIRASLLIPATRPQRPTPTFEVAANPRRPAPAEPQTTPKLSLASADLEPHIFHAAIDPGRTPADGRERALGARTPRARRAPTASEIGPVVKKGKAEIQACYQRALRQDPSLSRARINVSLDIGSSGAVKDVRLQPPPATNELAACIRKVTARWTFPPSPADYGTEFPVVLRGGN